MFLLPPAQFGSTLGERPLAHMRFFLHNRKHRMLLRRLMSLGLSLDLGSMPLSNFGLQPYSLGTQLYAYTSNIFDLARNALPQ